MSFSIFKLRKIALSQVMCITTCLALSFTNACFADEKLENAQGDTILILDDSIDQNAQTAGAQDSRNELQRWQNKAQEVLMSALSLTGIKYQYGGSNPSTGFDCSGFVRYVFSQATNLTLPPTARAISQIGKAVKKDELQPGDLVFFNTLKSAFSHVGIYVGNHKFIHAPRTGGEVRVEDMQNSYWQNRFDGAQRIDTEAEKTAPVAQK